MVKHIEIAGKLHEFSEMGGRGTPVWAVAKGKNLYRLNTGDILTVFSDAARKKVVWQGTVDLIHSGAPYPAPNLPQSGMAHHDWRKLFSAECPVQARLTKKEQLSF